MKTKNNNYSKFYALLKQFSKNGMDEQELKDQFVYQYTGWQTISLREMKPQEYRQMCADMQATIKSATAKRDDNPDKWRKRVIAVIGEYLRRVKGSDNIAEIKAITCRATFYEDFNLIPVSRLRDVYNQFLKTNKAMANTRSVIEIDLYSIASLN